MLFRYQALLCFTIITFHSSQLRAKPYYETFVSNSTVTGIISFPHPWRHLDSVLNEEIPRTPTRAVPSKLLIGVAPKQTSLKNSKLNKAGF